MKTALVTGASRGLGPTIALALAEAGWAVAVNYAHDEAGAQKAVSAIRRVGGQAIASRFDVTAEQAVTRGIVDVAERLGPIDLVVNNATGPQAARPVMEQDWELYARHFDFFVKAPLMILQAVLPGWRERKCGRIINIGSEVTETGPAFDAHYVAAKAAMIGLTRSWATELGPEGITVNLVSPGWVPVERHDGTGEDVYEEHLRSVPLKRMGSPRDVAGMVVFVASPAADYITGHNFVVNGGRTFAA